MTLTYSTLFASVLRHAAKIIISFHKSSRMYIHEFIYLVSFSFFGEYIYSVGKFITHIDWRNVMSIYARGEDENNLCVRLLASRLMRLPVHEKFTWSRSQYTTCWHRPPKIFRWYCVREVGQKIPTNLWAYVHNTNVVIPSVVVCFPQKLPITRHNVM